jgi:hypothetical protein
LDIYIYIWREWASMEVNYRVLCFFWPIPRWWCWCCWWPWRWRWRWRRW